MANSKILILSILYLLSLGISTSVINSYDFNGNDTKAILVFSTKLTKCKKPPEASHRLIKYVTIWQSLIMVLVCSMFRYVRISGIDISLKALKNLKPEKINTQHIFPQVSELDSDHNAERNCTALHHQSACQPTDHSTVSWLTSRYQMTDWGAS